MSKMTVIQLLNKIANDEEVPKKIKYEGRIWEYDSDVQDYMNEDIVEYLFANMFGMKTERVLNDEVEIIEEPKKIEKLNDKLGLFGDVNTQKIINELNYTRTIINKLIDEINNLKEK